MGRDTKNLSGYLIKSIIIYTLALGLATMLAESIFIWITDKNASGHPDQIQIALYLLSDIGLHVLFIICFARRMKRRIKQYNDTLVKERMKLMADMGHDIRTPLTSIMGFSRALATKKISNEEGIERAAETIYRKSADMEKMLEEMMDYAKNSLADRKKFIVPIHLNAFLRAIVAEHYYKFEENKMSLSCDFSNDAVLSLDETHFKRAFENILLNTLKYCPQGSEVLVKTEICEKRLKKTIRIYVADSGPEIPAHQQAQIFKPFAKLDDSRSQGGGYGLGLSIAYDITYEHGGKLYIEHMEPPYTKAFVMEFPIKETQSKASRGDK